MLLCSKGVESVVQHVDHDYTTSRALLYTVRVEHISVWSRKWRATEHRRRLGGCTAPRRRLHSRSPQDVANVPGREL